MIIDTTRGVVFGLPPSLSVVEAIALASIWQVTLLTLIGTGFLMEIGNYLIKIAAIGAIIILGASWLIYFSVKTLSKYTDFGKSTKHDKEKEERTYTSTDDLPNLKNGPVEVFYETPKIETSFGDNRIGEVHEHPKKT